jgi:hypothetical protein
MIGQLYSTQNVVVGQAACMVAQPNTPAPLPATALNGNNPAGFLEPFSLTPWTGAVVSTPKPLTAGTYILRMLHNGYWYPTAPINWNAPPVSASGATPLGINQVIYNALTTPTADGANPVGPALPIQITDISVTGGLFSQTGGKPTPFTITLSQVAQPIAWYMGVQAGILPTPTQVSVTYAKWFPIGATDAGWSFVSNKTTQEINIEEQSTPVMTTISTQTLSIQGDMAEDVYPTLAMAYNMTAGLNQAATATATAAALPGYHLLTPTDTPILYAVCLIMSNATNPKYGNTPRWIYIPVATCLANATAAFRRATAKRMYTVDFTSVCPIGNIAIYNFEKPNPL